MYRNKSVFVKAHKMNGFKFNCVKHNICKEKSNYHDDRFVVVKFRSSHENIEIYVKIII